MKRFIHLHCHTTHSLLDGFGQPKALVARAKELELPTLALTDHGTVSGWVQFDVACKEQSIKPIFGLEAYVVKDATVRERGYHHITLLAKDETGIQNIFKLGTQSYHEGFYYRPRLSWPWLIEHRKGLIVLSGCAFGFPFSGPWEKVEPWASEMKRLFKGDFFLEIQPHPVPQIKERIIRVVQLGARLGIPLVATNDVHYPGPKDKLARSILLQIAKHEKDDPQYKVDMDLHLRDWVEMTDAFHALGSATTFNRAIIRSMEIAEEIGSECEAKLPMAHKVKLKMPDAEKVRLFKAICKKRWQSLGLPVNREYRERFEYESNLILSKGLVDYFLIVTDIILWAKSKGIMVGPARGSSAGSLVCYLLGITEVDPIRFDLMFHRFIDVSRNDEPDIDIDVQDDRRDEVLAYIRQKYGEDHTAFISNYTTLRGKNCLWDIARIFGIPAAAINEFSKHIIERSSADARASFTIQDTIDTIPVAKAIADKHPEISQYAAILEGQIRGRGQHAAGLIISSEPSTQFGIIYNNDALCFDHMDAKKLGLLKIDILGLNTLGNLRIALDYVKARHGKDIDLTKVNLEDPATIRAFNEHKTVWGIFQMEGAAVASVLKQLTIHNFNDVMLIAALARPGSLRSGQTNQFVRARITGKKPPQEHPLLAKVTQDTEGVFIFQEQVMVVVREMGHFDWEQTNHIRVIMSKRSGDESFQHFADVFVKGAAKDGVSKDLAQRIWNRICTFGSWAFNKSHAVSYGILAFWTMWMKVHYPLEFYAACLKHMGADEKKHGLIGEMVRAGIKLLPPNLNRSEASFSIDGKDIRVGWAEVKGIGQKAGEEIAAHRPYKGWHHLLSTVNRRTVNKRVIRAMVELGTLPLEVMSSWDVASVLEIRPRFQALPDLVDFSIHYDYEALREKYQAKSVDECIEASKSLSMHKLYTNVVAFVASVDIRDLAEEARTSGQFKRLGRWTKLCHMRVMDDTGTMWCTISGPDYERLVYRALETKGRVILFKGTVRQIAPKLYVKELTDVHEKGACVISGYGKVAGE